MKKPSDFVGKYWNSIFQNAETEWVWDNIIIILKRTGDVWRELPWEEYVIERKKDGRFSESEKSYFDKVIMYTRSDIEAKLFSPKAQE